MSKGPGSKALLTFVFIGALGVGALALYVKTVPGASVVPAALHRHVEQSAPLVRRHHTKPTVENASEEESQGQRVRLPAIQGGKVSLAEDQTDVPAGLDPKVFVAQSVLKEDRVEGVRVMGVELRNGVAVINFSNGIDEGMGSMQEGAFLNALKAGFGQFPEVKTIQIYQDGEPLDSLGHIDLTDPISVTRPNGDSAQSSKPVEP